MKKIKKILSPPSTSISECHIWNLYGPAEVTIDCLYYIVDNLHEDKSVPVGHLLPGYRCLVLNDFLQPVFPGQQGELFVSGVGIFAGYLGRQDLTEQVLLNIDGEEFYRTGDLVRYDAEDDVFYYLGRKDHQVKIHGQRIELGEIERCLLNLSSTVETCAVIKHNDDHLIAYVQSANVTEEELRKHCYSSLPPFMIPSVFVILPQLPINANGKLDRRHLPTLDISSLTKKNQEQNVIKPANETEMQIHSLWCELFKCEGISTTTNIFSIGGHSLLVIQLYHQYKTLFHFDTTSLNITDLFQHSTIVDHARLILSASTQVQTYSEEQQQLWHPLRITQGKYFDGCSKKMIFFLCLGQASFAQERIFLDEQVRFHSQNEQIYGIRMAYRVSSASKPLSIQRLQQAMKSLVNKHAIFRTKLFVDSGGVITQLLCDVNDGFVPCTIINLNQEKPNNLSNIILSSNLFDLNKGQVLHCHIIRRSSSTYQNEDELLNDDVILFQVHHSAFDGVSTSIFLRDLSLAYQDGESLAINDDTLQYIDYSTHERQLDLTPSREFWSSQLQGYDLEHRLALPVDHHRLPHQQRSGRACVAELIFDEQLTKSFLTYAASSNITTFQLGLALFYAFLFKVTDGQEDLCVGCVNANRYRSELRDVIGMFVATLPYRLRLDPSGSFEQLLQQVRDRSVSILPHSHYPLQRIIEHQHSPAFLETMYDFVTVLPDIEQVHLDGAQLETVSFEEEDIVAKFDLMLNFVYKPSTGMMSCSLICSEDVFNQATVQKLADRFSHLLHQVCQFSNSQQSLRELSIILPEEQLLINTLKTHDIDRPPTITKKNTIHQLFTERTLMHPQKMAVELDEQMITYSELLFYAQKLALKLVDEHGVKEGDIICQCVERSITMVIGMMAIELCGCVYCPLSPQDPEQRLFTLLKETKYRLLLVDQLTGKTFASVSNRVDVESSITDDRMINADDADRLSKVEVTKESIAYIVFTSGSTGIPKAVSCEKIYLK